MGTGRKGMRWGLQLWPGQTPPPAQWDAWWLERGRQRQTETDRGRGRGMCRCASQLRMQVFVTVQRGISTREPASACVRLCAGVLNP